MAGTGAKARKKRDTGGRPAIPEGLVEELERLAAAAMSVNAAQALWKRLSRREKDRVVLVARDLGLQPAGQEIAPEQTTLIDEELTAWLRTFGGPVALYCAMRGCSTWVAIVNLAVLNHAIPMFPDGEALLAQVRAVEETWAAEERVKPVWVREQGELWYADCVIYRFGFHGKSRMPAILDEFEDAQWAAEVPSPIDASKDKCQALRNALRTLNKGIDGQVISFHTRDRGTTVHWQRSSAALHDAQIN